MIHPVYGIIEMELIKPLFIHKAGLAKVQQAHGYKIKFHDDHKVPCTVYGAYGLPLNLFSHNGFLRQCMNINGIDVSLTHIMLASAFPGARVEETVDHIDNDFTNNHICNLQWLSRSLNSAKASLAYNKEKPKAGLSVSMMKKGVILHTFPSVASAASFVKRHGGDRIKGSPDTISTKILRAIKDMPSTQEPNTTQHETTQEVIEAQAYLDGLGVDLDIPKADELAGQLASNRMRLACEADPMLSKTEIRSLVGKERLRAVNAVRLARKAMEKLPTAYGYNWRVSPDATNNLPGEEWKILSINEILQQSNSTSQDIEETDNVMECIDICNERNQDVNILVSNRARVKVRDNIITCGYALRGVAGRHRYIQIKGKHIRMNRLVYAAFCGPIPVGMCVMHKSGIVDSDGCFRNWPEDLCLATMSEVVANMHKNKRSHVKMDQLERSGSDYHIDNVASESNKKLHEIQSKESAHESPSFTSRHFNAPVFSLDQETGVGTMTKAGVMFTFDACYYDVLCKLNWEASSSAQLQVRAICNAHPECASHALLKGRIKIGLRQFIYHVLAGNPVRQGKTVSAKRRAPNKKEQDFRIANMCLK